MNPVYYDVAFYLDANGFGTLGTDLFGGEWGQVDKQILVLGGAGTPSELKSLYEMPDIQILVRGNKSESDRHVYAIAKGVSDLLLSALDNVDINGTCYTGFEPSSNIAPLGKDENERFIYSMNFTTYRNAFDVAAP